MGIFVGLGIFVSMYFFKYFFQGLINVSFVKQSSGEIQVIATRKEQQPIALPTMAPPLPGIPKCTTGKTIHSDGVTLISGTMGKTAWSFIPLQNVQFFEY